MRESGRAREGKEESGRVREGKEESGRERGGHLSRRMPV